MNPVSGTSGTSGTSGIDVSDRPAPVQEVAAARALLLLAAQRHPDRIAARMAEAGVVRGDPAPLAAYVRRECGVAVVVESEVWYVRTGHRTTGPFTLPTPIAWAAAQI